MKITIKKPRYKNADWSILKDGKKIDQEVSLDKAIGAKEFYMGYYKKKK